LKREEAAYGTDMVNKTKQSQTSKEGTHSWRNQRREKPETAEKHIAEPVIKDKKMQTYAKNRNVKRTDNRKIRAESYKEKYKERERSLNMYTRETKPFLSSFVFSISITCPSFLTCFGHCF